jgi:hypothetical protein
VLKTFLDFELEVFSNLMAIEVVKIAPKSHGRGRCKKINKTEPQKPMKSASNI